MNNQRSEVPPQSTPPVWLSILLGIGLVCIAALRHIGCFFLWLILQIRIHFAQRAMEVKVREMGQTMLEAEVGDAQDRQAVQGSRGQTEKDEHLLRLGMGAMGATAGMFEATPQHKAANQAWAHRVNLGAKSEDVWSYVCPNTPGGWLVLAAGYPFFIAAVLVVLTFAAPTVAPARLVAWLNPQRPAILQPDEHTRKVGKLSVRVKEVRIRRTLPGEKAALDEPVLVVLVEIHLDADGSVTEYKTWRGSGKGDIRDYATIMDSVGNQIDRVAHKRVPLTGVEKETLNPGQTVNDVLLFLQPKAGAAYIELFLPGHNLGLAETETFRYRIPRDHFETAMD